MAQTISSLLDIGASPDDTEDLRLQKRMLVAVAVLISVAAVIWSVAYNLLGEPLAALFPGSYAVLSSLNLGALAATKRYRMFRATQLTLILALPFLLQLALGGFVGGSAVIVWALMAPFGALVMQGRDHAVRYMIAYGVLLVASLALQQEMTIVNSLSAEIVGIFFLMNVLTVSVVVFVIMNYFVGQRDRIQEALRLEQDKSENLLLNILPAEVAADLKESGQTEARSFSNATVLFADQVGFTEFAGRRGADEVVATLNDVFTGFDGIVAGHEVEKIRTIGDAFMAVSGVPVENEDHARSMASAALEMMEFIDEYGEIEFRIGIHTGPLVAGVVGTSKFQYDVWGDTVNMASRMESTAEPGRVQISEATYLLIADRFECEPRGLVDIKGKGEVKTWYLIG